TISLNNVKVVSNKLTVLNVDIKDTCSGCCKQDLSKMQVNSVYACIRNGYRVLEITPSLGLIDWVLSRSVDGHTITRCITTGEILVSQPNFSAKILCRSS